MQNSKKTFISGLNTDDSYFAHKQDDNVDALNVRVVSSSEGKSGSLSNITGNREVTNSGLLYGGGNNKVIGTYEDPTTNNIFYFVTKPSGYSYIFMYKSDEEIVYTVLEDANLNSDYSLNFQPTEAITGITFIDGLLYWTGVKDREPCRINVDRGIKLNHPLYSTDEEAYESPIKKNIVTVIRKPPMMPLTIRVVEDADRDTSFLKSRSLTFAYRYVYRDGEISVFSPTTPHYPNQDMDNTDHEESKKIVVGYPLNEATPTGVSDDIEKIQFAVRFDKDTSYFVWKEFTRNSHPSEFISQTSYVPNVIKGDYYNDVLGSSVDDSNSIKLYDTVPYEAQALEIGRNRLFLGNFKEGLLNTRKMVSEDMQVSVDVTPFNSGLFNQEIRDRGGIVGFACSSAYQVGLAFFDFAGRTAGVLTDDSMKVITNERNLAYTTYNSFVSYDLSGETSKSLIPEWATHYSILRTKNLIKDFTIGNLASKIRYYQFDSNESFTVRVEKVDDEGDPTGKFSANEFTSFSQEHEGIAIGLGDLTSYKQGYSYQEGDRIKLITDSNVMEFAITGTQGRYVLANLVDLNSGDYLGQTSLANADYSVVYEIFSPHKIQPNEFYYESVRGKIMNPGSNDRTYDNLQGKLIGDVYMKARIADTSNIEPHFFEASARSENASSDPFKGQIAYIGFPYFHGEGLNDMSANTGTGNYNNGNDHRFEIKITSTSGNADQFQWRKRIYSQRMVNHAWGNTTTITGNLQTLSDGVQVKFDSTTGHTVGDKWAVNAKHPNTGLGNLNSKTYSHYQSPPNGVIFANSEVKIHHKEHQNKLFGDDHHEWTVTMNPNEVTKNFATIEEMYWESDLGQKICAVHGDGHIFFRRSTIDPASDGGRNQMFILDEESEPSQQSVSQSDGTLVNMTIRSQLTQNNDAEAKVETHHDIRVDQPDEYSYSAESMNPSDDYFLNWVQITGRPNLIPKDVSSQNKVTGIAFSETKIPGSKVNGLSKFSALDEDRLDDATGPLRVLAMTSKTQSTGTVMLAVSENETTSIYLGEQQLQQASSGSQFLAVSKGVIGTKNSLQGSFGTLHPESLAVNEGKAYWYDVKNATVIKYDTNGLMPIGDVKMKTYFKEKSDIIVSDSSSGFIPGTYDAYNNEYLITMPETGETEVILQGPGKYGDNPVQTHTNTPVIQEPGFFSGKLPVSVQSPWESYAVVDFVDGLGHFSFNSPYSFNIESDVVQLPTGSQITVVNASSGGFEVQNSSDYLSGNGKLTIDKVPATATRIELKLKRIKTVAPKQDILVNNPLGISGTKENPVPFDFTPVRLVEPDYVGVQEEQKTIESETGVLVIPITSNFKFKLGNSSPEYGFSYYNNGVKTQIPIENISTNATAIGSDSSLHYYQPGNWNLNIQGIEDTTTRVDILSKKLSIPVISTFESTDITKVSLTAKGEIEDIGEGSLSEKGFVISSVNSIPAIGQSNTTKVTVLGGSDVGTIQAVIETLTPGTSYHIRLYVITSLGTAYANNITTQTGEQGTNPPDVDTIVYDSTDKIEGIINADGGSPITKYGFVTSAENNDPEIGDTNVVERRVTGTINEIPHSFIYPISPKAFADDTTYYYKAFAENNAGIVYGAVSQFKTEKTNDGKIAIINVTTSTVPRDGGDVYITLEKTFDSGEVSGSILVSDTIGNSKTLIVEIPEEEPTGVVVYPIPENTGRTRNIGFSIQNFEPENMNGTGQNVPILIKSTVSQNGQDGDPFLSEGTK